MERRIVNIDFDDVLSQTDLSLKAAIRGVIGNGDHTHLQNCDLLLEEIIHVVELGNITQHDDYRVNELGLRFLRDPDFLLRIPPHQDAVESIRKLDQAGYEVHVVTARVDSSQTRIASIQWLKERGFSPYVTQIHHRPPNIEPAVFKREISKQINPHAIFEDHWAISQMLAIGGMPVYLITRDWNRAVGRAWRSRLITWATLGRDLSFAEATEHFLNSNLV